MQRIGIFASSLALALTGGCSALIDSSKYVGEGADGGIDASMDAGGPDGSEDTGAPDDTGMSHDGAVDAARDAGPREDGGGCGGDCAWDEMCVDGECRPCGVPRCGDEERQGCPGTFEGGPRIEEWGRFPVRQVHRGAVPDGASAAFWRRAEAPARSAVVGHALEDDAALVLFDPADPESGEQILLRERVTWRFDEVISVRAKDRGALAVAVGGRVEGGEADFLGLYYVHPGLELEDVSFADGPPGYVKAPVDIAARSDGERRIPIAAWQGTESDDAVQMFSLGEGGANAASGDPQPVDGRRLFVADGPLAVGAAQATLERLVYWFEPGESFAAIPFEGGWAPGSVDTLELALEHTPEAVSGLLLAHMGDGTRLAAVEVQCEYGAGCEIGEFVPGPEVRKPVVTAIPWARGTLAFAPGATDALEVQMHRFEGPEHTAGPVAMFTHRELEAPIVDVQSLDADWRPLENEDGERTGTDVLLAMQLELEEGGEGIWASGVRFCNSL